APRRSTPPATAGGATARDGALEFALTGLRCGDTELGTWPVRKRATGRYCLVSVRVSNIGSHTGLIFTGSQRLVDTAGRQYPADRWAWVYSATSRALTGTVDPGQALNGTLVFDVPADAHLTRMIVHDTPLSRGTELTLPS
ncbi:MAG: hypothetical protein QOE03_1996, partial [Micromonosporaceae bacterium]|nr:hypothetical protein [Micromonosporaceae bacterium]